MEYTTFKNEWRVPAPTDEPMMNLLRAQNETNRLLAEIGTLLEKRIRDPKAPYDSGMYITGTEPRHG